MVGDILSGGSCIVGGESGGEEMDGSGTMDGIAGGTVGGIGEGGNDGWPGASGIWIVGGGPGNTSCLCLRFGANFLALLNLTW